ncbi:chromatin modification-related protein eaf6 [Lecanora helva]
MAENIPPANSNADATRGVPYYEKLKRDLRDTLQKKKLLDKNLELLEQQIFRFEASYLEETGAGNIIKGFDNYIKGSSTVGTTTSTGGGTSTRRKGQIMDADRVFSRSSISFMRELSPSSSLQTTPSHAATPTSGNPHPPLSARDGNHGTPSNAAGTKGGQGNKKNKKGDKDDEEVDGRGPKRLKITYNRGGVGD